MAANISWNDILKDYCAYLKLELSLSDNSVNAYKSDVSNLLAFVAGESVKSGNINDKDNTLTLSVSHPVTKSDIDSFFARRMEEGMTIRSQSRYLNYSSVPHPLCRGEVKTAENCLNLSHRQHIWKFTREFRGLHTCYRISKPQILIPLAYKRKKRSERA